jgi:hypothetical protein
VEFGWLTLPLSVAGRLMQRSSWWPSKLLARVQRQGGPVTWLAGLSPDQKVSEVAPDLAALFDTSLGLLDPAEPLDRLARRILFAGRGWRQPRSRRCCSKRWRFLPR